MSRSDKASNELLAPNWIRQRGGAQHCWHPRVTTVHPFFHQLVIDRSFVVVFFSFFLKYIYLLFMAVRMVKLSPYVNASYVTVCTQFNSTRLSTVDVDEIEQSSSTEGGNECRSVMDGDCDYGGGRGDGSNLRACVCASATSTQKLWCHRIAQTAAAAGQ